MSQRIHLISDREYCDPTDDFLALERALRAEQLAEHQERLMDEQRDREAERHDEGGEP